MESKIPRTVRARILIEKYTGKRIEGFLFDDIKAWFRRDKKKKEVTFVRMKLSEKRKNRWTTISIILSLAWPTILEQVMQTAVQYIDTAMVGSLGTYATAAVGATTTLGWLVNSTMSALGIGFLAYIAKACGAGDRPAAKKAVSQAVLVTLVAGGLSTVLLLSLSGVIPLIMQVDENIRQLTAQYFFILYTPMMARAAITIFGTVLRAAGDTKTPMKVGLVVNAVNVVLNFLFIYETRPVKVLGYTIILPGTGWGVVGAAVASYIAFVV